MLVAGFAGNAVSAIIKRSYNNSVAGFPFGNLAANFFYNSGALVTHNMGQLFNSVIKTALKKVQIRSANSAIRYL